MKLWPDLCQHGAKAGQSSHKVGDRFCHKDSVDAQVKEAGQDQNQGDYDNNLPENGEKHGIFRFSQSYEHRLSGKLQRHHKKAKIIDLHGRNPGGNKIALMVENPDKKFREAMDEAPHDGGVADRYNGHEKNGFFNPFILCGSIVVSHNRLGAVGKAADGKGDYFPHRVDYGHNAYIDVSAVTGQTGIVHDLDQAVGDRHGKSGKSQSDNTQNTLTF